MCLELEFLSKKIAAENAHHAVTGAHNETK